MSDEQTQTDEDTTYLGDAVSNVLEAVGGKTIAAVVEKITKKPCNCEKNRRRLNAIDSMGREKYRAMASKVKDLINGNQTE